MSTEPAYDMHRGRAPWDEPGEHCMGDTCDPIECCACDCDACCSARRQDARQDAIDMEGDRPEEDDQ